jgi:ATP-dependent 26S proteasome regulatory subunit
VPDHGLLLLCEQVSVDVPDQKGRLEILKVHARNKKLSTEVRSRPCGCVSQEYEQGVGAWLCGL